MTELTLPRPRLSFSKKNPKLQFAWDSVSLGVAKTCWRKYQLQIIEGWQPKHLSHHLKYGQLYHRALEVYDHHMFLGKSHEESMMEALWDLKEGCTEWVTVGEETCPQCKGAAGDYSGPCHDCRGQGVIFLQEARWWNPHEHLSEERAKRDYKTVPNLFRTVVWYLDQFGVKDECKTVRLANGKPAVELSFRYELGHTLSTGEEVVHSGHIDRLVDLGGLTYVLDRKTTGTTISGSSSWGYFAKYSPDNQMSGYCYAGRTVLTQPVSGIIIDAAQIAQGFSRFERGFSLRTEGQLEEWRDDTLYYIAEADRLAQADYYPMNDSACDHYGGCAFRPVCSRDPGVREMYLASDYVKRPWDPLETRGDI